MEKSGKNCRCNTNKIKEKIIEGRPSTQGGAQGNNLVPLFLLDIKSILPPKFAKN
jgi:hypothetical protein